MPYFIHSKEFSGKRKRPLAAAFGCSYFYSTESGQIQMHGLENSVVDIVEVVPILPAPNTLHRFKAGALNVEIHLDHESASKAAANDAARTLIRLGKIEDEFGAMFATGGSQIGTLEALTSTPGLPWDKVLGFHLDEYVALPIGHPASFRGYLRHHLTSKVKLREFYGIDGTVADVEMVCERYAAKLRAINPRLCLLGVGENGHLAFNDPGEANFEDRLDVKIVHLDAVCRQQQASEGWFRSLDEVPQTAITVTIPALFRVPKLVLTVLGPRKATAVKDLIEGPISTRCPASILRRHTTLRFIWIRRLGDILALLTQAGRS